MIGERAEQAVLPVHDDHAGLDRLVGHEERRDDHLVARVEVPCGGAVDDDLRARGVAGFEELLSACVDLGVRFIACEMGLRAMQLQPSALRSDVPIEVAGVVTFLGDASAGGAMLVL